MASLRDNGFAGTWIYSGDPATSNKDWVRWKVGDTNSTDQLVSDEEIGAAVTAEGHKALAAAVICEHLAARYSREADQTINDGSGSSRTRSLSQRAGAFMKLATSLRTQSSVTIGVSPFLGGSSVVDKAAREDDTDRVAPAFTTGMSDFT